MSVALPAVTDWNRFYWTSGSDGRLRFQCCGACGSLQHPPAPMCRGCGANELAAQEVSEVQGAATVVVSSGGLTPGGVILFRVDD